MGGYPLATGDIDTSDRSFAGGYRYDINVESKVYVLR